MSSIRLMEAGKRGPTSRASLYRAIFVFAGSLACGLGVGLLGGLFTYANALDPHMNDAKFAAVVIVGALLGAVVGYFLARRSMADAIEINPQQGMSLLRKYGHDSPRSGADLGAGQYNIGETYLKQLTRRR